MKKINVTKHGFERMRERIKIPKRSVLNVGKKACQRGQPRTSINSGIRKYLDKLHKVGKYYKKDIEIYVYGQYIFVIADRRDIITTFKVPARFRKVAKSRREDRGKEEDI